MAKLMLHTFELSDIKKVVEDVLKNQLQKLTVPKREELLLLTRKETAKLLCISLPTLHEWTKTGIIKAYRIGNRVLYKQEEVKQALNQIQTSVKEGGLRC